MPSTYDSDSVNPRARVTRAPSPMMIADRIGIIGYEQGSKLSTTPATKYSPMIARKPAALQQ